MYLNTAFWRSRKAKRSRQFYTFFSSHLTAQFHALWPCLDLASATTRGSIPKAEPHRDHTSDTTAVATPRFPSNPAVTTRAFLSSTIDGRSLIAMCLQKIENIFGVLNSAPERENFSRSVKLFITLYYPEAATPERDPTLLAERPAQKR